MKEVTVSAPGKVLLAGGYLVLEAPNVGVVIATNKRFYCTVKAEDSSVPSDSTDIIVYSPQFHSQWSYRLKRNEFSELVLSPSQENESVNGFVEKTLRLTLSYVIACDKELPPKLNLTIRADNDFYSVLPHLKERRLEATPENVDSLPPFLPCPQDANGKAVVNKTGLGSSAALVTSCVGALLNFFGLAVGTRVYNLAQISHCHAQGKVGSGFDVSAAVNGSHVYWRFPKCILPDLLQQLQNEIMTNSTMELLAKLVESEWEGGVMTPLKLPSGLQLLLADVCGGSESPSMARKVLAWKTSREKPEEEPFWEELQGLNPQIVKLLDTKVDVEVCSNTTAKEWETSQPSLVQLYGALRKSRSLLKRMGEAAGVPVEPDEQTLLANATQELPGVVTAIVPGAGGYDALACLYVDGEGVKSRIGKLWANWREGDTQVCPLAVEAGSYGEGLRVEKNFSS